MVPRNSMFVVGLARRNADRVAITSSKSCLGFSGDMLSPIARGAHIIRRHPYREKSVARLPFIKALRGAHRLRHHPYRGAGDCSPFPSSKALWGALRTSRHPYDTGGLARLPFVKAPRGAHRLRHHPLYIPGRCYRATKSILLLLLRSLLVVLRLPSDHV